MDISIHRNIYYRYIDMKMFQTMAALHVWTRMVRCPTNLGNYGTPCCLDPTKSLSCLKPRDGKSFWQQLLLLHSSRQTKRQMNILSGFTYFLFDVIFMHAHFNVCQFTGKCHWMNVSQLQIRHFFFFFNWRRLTISPWRHNVVVLIRSALSRHF